MDLILIGAGLLIGFFDPEWWKVSTNIVRYFQSPEKVARKSLRRLNQQVFSCFLKSTYPDNTYLYEHRIHLSKVEFIKAITRLDESRKADSKQVKKLKQLFGAILNNAQLRWRVRDFTVFSVCGEEFAGLAKATDAVLSYQQKLSSTNLDVAIANLEDMFQQVLKISSSEPLVFLLFIAAMKEFAREVAE